MFSPHNYLIIVSWLIVIERYYWLEDTSWFQRRINVKKNVDLEIQNLESICFHLGPSCFSIGLLPTGLPECSLRPHIYSPASLLFSRLSTGNSCLPTKCIWIAMMFPYFSSVTLIQALPSLAWTTGLLPSSSKPEGSFWRGSQPHHPSCQNSPEVSGCTWNTFNGQLDLEYI